LNTSLCDRFLALDPFKVRKERFHEVLLVFSRTVEQTKRTKKDKTKTKDGVIRRPAKNDDWW
jgi:hypothetical protein